MLIGVSITRNQRDNCPHRQFYGKYVPYAYRYVLCTPTYVRTYKIIRNVIIFYNFSYHKNVDLLINFLYLKRIVPRV